MTDLRFALRMFRRNPGFALIAIVTLAIGIGATTAIFSIVWAAALRPLPYGDPGSLLQVWQVRTDSDKAPLSGPDLLDILAGQKSFTSLVGYTYITSFNLLDGDLPERIQGSITTPAFFETLGVTPLAGTADLGAAADRRAVIGERLWRRRFGASPSVVGTDVRLGGESYRIAGVIPDSFDLPAEAEVWVRTDADMATIGVRGYHQYRTIGRLAPGVTMKAAEAELEAIAARLGETYPNSNRGVGIDVVPLAEELRGDMRSELLLILGAVGFLLLIACTNVANLFLARAASRQREMAIRRSLGAGSRTILGQLLTEAMLLSIAGGALAIGVAMLALRAISLMEVAVPFADQIRIEPVVLAFNFGVALLTGLLFGGTPAIQPGGRFQDLRSGRTETNRGWESRRLRDSLVVAEIALSLLLLTGAGLLFRSFLSLRQVDPGARVEGILRVRLSLPDAKYPDEQRINAFWDALTLRLSERSGIDGAAVTTGVPLHTTMNGHLTFPDQSPDYKPIAFFAEVSESYFRTAGVPLISGRYLERSDTDRAADTFAALEKEEADVPPVPIVINRAMQQRFWPNEHPIGKRAAISGALPVEVVGVVGDVLQESLREPAKPQLYMPLGIPLPSLPMNVIVRSSMPEEALVGVVREEIRAIDPELPFYDAEMLGAILSDKAGENDLQMLLMGSFALVALLLAGVGIYGVLGYMVSQRTREFGVRLALGAGKRDLLALVLGRSTILALTGIALGLLAAGGLTRLLESKLFGVARFDPAVVASCSAILIACAILAAAIPARRAASVDPAVSLRNE